MQRAMQNRKELRILIAERKFGRALAQKLHGIIYLI